MIQTNFSTLVHCDFFEIAHIFTYKRRIGASPFEPSRRAEPGEPLEDAAKFMVRVMKHSSVPTGAPKISDLQVAYFVWTLSRRDRPSAPALNQ